jgi:hypothetical protein
MTPTYAVKKGARYRYYVSSALRGGPVGASKQSQVFHVGMMLALHGPSQFRNTIRRKNGIGDGAS